MNCRRFIISTGALLLASGLAEAQKKKEQTPVSSGAVIQSETKLVVVDVVAADKKGNYVGNLEAKDFRVWEDNKEQTIKTFSSGTEVAPTRYLILFFDGLNLSPINPVRDSLRHSSHRPSPVRLAGWRSSTSTILCGSRRISPGTWTALPAPSSP